MTAHGCTERRHFGYAYFDAQCVKAEVAQAPYCPAYDPNLTLEAPEGFAAYRWSNGATSPTIAVAPKQGEKFWVKVKPFSSLGDDCEFQFDHTVDFTLPGEPTREAKTICEGDSDTLGDSTYRRAGTYLTRIRRGPNVCDSVVITTLRVTPLARFAQSRVICGGERLIVGPDALTATGRYKNPHRA